MREMDSMPGRAAEIFCDRVRRIFCDHKLTGGEWLETTRTRLRAPVIRATRVQ